MGQQNNKNKIPSDLVEAIEQLPEEVAWQYRNCTANPKPWKFEGNPNGPGFYSIEYSPQSPEYSKVIKLLTSLGGSDLPVEKIYAVYNPALVGNFVGHKSIMERRLQNSPWVESWRDNDPNLLRAHVFKEYHKTLNKHSWNSSAKIPVIPVVHGTDFMISQKIAKTGFVSLSSLDSGFFGQGIYFTTNAMYALPYARLQNAPALIISYVIPGNVYPVTEQHKDKQNSLMGTPLRAPGYNSHYVVTKKDGFALSNPEDQPVFDEIVIAQEAQVTPAFIIKLEANAKLTQFYSQWERALCQINDV